MANNILNTRLKLKTDTEANWIANNPVLLKGEMAISSDKYNRYKIGDGTTAWNSLAYSKADPTSHNHDSNYLKLSGGTLTKDSFGILRLKRSGTTYGVGIEFENDNGLLGSICMTGGANGGLLRYNSNGSNYYTVIDTGNKDAYVYPPATHNHNTSYYTKSEIDTKMNGKANTHSHPYLNTSGGTLTGDTQFNSYLKLNAWSGYGTGTANFWYNANTKTVEVENAELLKLAGVKVSKEGHTHDDRYYTESEINTKLSGKADNHSHPYLPLAGGTLTGDINSVLYTVNTSKAYTPNSSSLAASPYARTLWHDHFAFLRDGTTIHSNKVTTNGTTWTDDTSATFKDLFIQKEKSSVQVLTNSQLKRQIVLKGNNIAWSGIEWIEMGVSFNNPSPRFKITIENSADGNTWTAVNSSVISGNAFPIYLKASLGGSNPYIRFTFEKLTELTTGSVSITSIKGWSMRKGNQGLGIENEMPYDWNSNCDILPVVSGQSNLGTSTKKWKSFNGFTIEKSVPSNAVFTDTDTKVTSAANHYSPATDNNYGLSVDASSTASAATWNTTSVVTGVNITRDSKGHITGLSVDSAKMPVNPNVSDITTFNKTLTVTTDWQDVGISGTDLSSGSYIVQISGMSSDATRLWYEIFTGVMSWYDGGVNNETSEEIVLHCAGHATNGRRLFLRTTRVSHNNNGTSILKLQIAASHDLGSSPYTFKFRKLI